MNPPPIIPAPKRRHRQRKSSSNTATVPLNLIAADYFVAEYLDLTFDRAIDVSGIVGSQIWVDDMEVTSIRYYATGTATIVEPNKVRLELTTGPDIEGSGLYMTATEENGIVAADDDGPWAGIVDLGLPFPS